MDALDPLLLVGAFDTDGAFETVGAPLGTAEIEGAALGLALGMHVGPSALLHEALSKSIQLFDDNGVDANSVPAKYTSTNASCTDDVDLVGASENCEGLHEGALLLRHLTSYTYSPYM